MPRQEQPLYVIHAWAPRDVQQRRASRLHAVHLLPHPMKAVLGLSMAGCTVHGAPAEVPQSPATSHTYKRMERRQESLG